MYIKILLVWVLWGLNNNLAVFAQSQNSLRHFNLQNQNTTEQRSSRLPSKTITMNMRRFFADVSLLTSKAQYLAAKGDQFQINRQTAGIGLGYTPANDTVLNGRVLKIIRTELADVNEFSGSGYAVEIGLTKLYPYEAIVFKPHFDLNYSTEKLNYEEATTEIKFYELALGIEFEFASSPYLRPFVGLEVYPVNVGQSKTGDDDKAKLSSSTSASSGPGINDNKQDAIKKRDGLISTHTFSREEMLCMKVGGRTLINKFMLGGEAKLVSETSFAVMAGVIF